MEPRGKSAVIPKLHVFQGLSRLVVGVCVTRWCDTSKGALASSGRCRSSSRFAPLRVRGFCRRLHGGGMRFCSGQPKVSLPRLLAEMICADFLTSRHGAVAASRF